MEQVSWSIATQAAQWLSQALKAAHTKDQQRFARLIEHVGTIVAGLRALDREAHRLFLPMLYGDVSKWPKDQRDRWAQDLVSFAHEDTITPAIRIALNALDDLKLQQSDRDVARLVKDITNLLDWQPGQAFYWGPVGMLCRANVTGEFDFLIGTELDDLLKVLEHPEGADLEAMRTTVAQFVYGDATRVQSSLKVRYSRSELQKFPRTSLYKMWRQAINNEQADSDDIEYEVEPSQNLVTTLRPYADNVEGVFGQLLALQNRIFPELPTPVWAWQT